MKSNSAPDTLFFDRTWSKVYLKLVGQDGEGKCTRLTGTASVFGVHLHGEHSKSIGKLVLIEVEKMKLSLLPELSWFVGKVEVTSPEKETFTFPIFHWIRDEEVHRFREGEEINKPHRMVLSEFGSRRGGGGGDQTALVFGQDHSLLGKYTRQKELQVRREQYGWFEYAQGLPHCMNAHHVHSLPCDVHFSFTKDEQFKLTAAEGVLEIKLKHLADCKHNWTSFDAVYKIFHRHRTRISEYVQKHWKDDAFFGSQFLNGLDPTVIRRCSSLPMNFPVTDDMLFLHGAGSLAQEMQRGHIFICDYKSLDGVKANVIHDKQQYLTAPLVLLHKTPEGELKPIAIQLMQTPGEDNPIFLPSDSEYDWILAKTFVRSAYFNEHELNVHLLRTHLLAEVFTLALLRNLPMVHPLYKLLIPHTRYTLQINFMARQLISPNGAFTLYSSSGGEGMKTILQRSLSTLTYTSLCLPDDIADRGVQFVPHYHYRDDGLALWNIIHKFVNGILSFYYKDNKKVEDDHELQNWIQEIFEHGFLSNESSGIPQHFYTVPELVKFVSMVIFTCSAQHSAVSNGQFDFGGWMPNAPSSLQLPPPTTKGTATEETLLNTLPDVSTTVHAMAVLYLLSKQSTDFVPLGQYPNEYFCEDTPLSLIKVFQKELQEQQEAIEKRNKKLTLPYVYLEPKLMENSATL